MDLELSTLARWCEQCGKLMASNRGIWPDATSGTGNFSNGVDLVPTRDGIKIAGIRFYVPRNLGLVGHTLRLSLWDNLSNARLRVADYKVLAGAEGMCLEVGFGPYSCEPYHNVCISGHDLGPNPQWWLLDNNLVRAAIWGTLPHIAPGYLTQVPIGGGLWRCGPYYIAGDADPCSPGGTYMQPAGQPLDHIPTIDPIIQE